MERGSKSGQVTQARKSDDGSWIAEWGSGPVAARSVLLATGVTNRRPPMDMELHDDAHGARADPLLPDLRRL